MSTIRPRIPEKICREVRRRSGFGCIMCGCPVIDYHHIIPWEQVQVHEADNITLLCPNHHRQANKGGSIPEKIIRSHVRQPHNLLLRRSAEHELIYRDNNIMVQVGGYTYKAIDFFSDHETQHPVIILEDEAAIWIDYEDEHLLISAKLHDSDDDEVFWINKNQMAYSTKSWDVQFLSSASRLIIHEKSRRIFIEIIFRPPWIRFIKGRFFFKGIEIKLSENVFSARIGGSELNVANSISESQGEVKGASAGIYIGAQPELFEGCFIVLDPRINF